MRARRSHNRAHFCFNTPDAFIASAKSTKARRRWTGWRARAGNAASPSRRRPRPEWRFGHDREKHRINIIDTPGHADFTVEVERSLRCFLMASSPSLRGSAACSRNRKPSGVRPIGMSGRIAYINKMDRDGANFYEALTRLPSVWGAKGCPVTADWRGSGFNGIVDLVETRRHIQRRRQAGQHF